VGRIDADVARRDRNHCGLTTRRGSRAGSRRMRLPARQCQAVDFAEMSVA
jgi:hypothetical protein